MKKYVLQPVYNKKSMTFFTFVVIVVVIAASAAF